MIKNVRVRLTGYQTDPEGSTDKNEQEFPAQYYYKNNCHYLVSENEQTAKSARYKFNHRYLEVIRDGDIYSKLTFDTKKYCSTMYKTPYGRMEFVFNTHQITLSDTPEEIRMEISYEMSSGGQLVSNNRTVLIIRPETT